MIFPLYSHDFPPSVSFPIARQADATEFSALLLDWLQRELSASWEPRKNAVFWAFSDIIWWLLILFYPLVNKQLDPENHHFLEETNLPTPIYQGLC